ncbi:MAG: HEAT repeat domain-containing protein [bacterium]|nr:HEAT repeat domain-containing protein [bacterium]
MNPRVRSLVTCIRLAPVLAAVLGIVLAGVARAQDTTELSRTARGRDYGPAKSAVAGLVRSGPNGVRGLIGALDSPHIAIRIEALRGLVHVGPHSVVALRDVAPLVGRQDAVPDLPLAFAGAHLEARLEADRAEVDAPSGLSLDLDRRPRRMKPPRIEDARNALRVEALVTLACLGAYDPSQLLGVIRTVPEKGGLAFGAWSDTRLLFGLAVRGRSDAVELVRSALAGDSVETQAAGLGAVPWLKRRADEVAPLVLERLASEHPGVRLRALALVPSLTYTCEELWPRLVSALDDRQLDARLLAAGSLFRLCQNGQRPLPPELAAVVRSGIAEQPRPKPTRTVLLGIDAQVEMQTLPESHAAALTALLDHRSPDVRARSALCLGRFGTEARGALVALRRKLRDQEAKVRRAAQDALEQITR